MNKQREPYKIDFRNIKEGDFVAWNAPQFQDAIFEYGRCVCPPKFIGSIKYAGKIIKEIYGRNNRHMFSVELSEPPELKGTKKAVKGKDLYPNMTQHIRAIKNRLNEENVTDA